MESNYGNLLEVFGKLVYTHKTHEKAIERLENKIKLLKIIQIVLLALTSASVLTTITDIFSPIFENNPILFMVFNLFLVFTSFTATGISIFDLSSTDKEDVNRHKIAAAHLLYLREKYIILLADYKDGIIEKEQLIERRDLLIEKLSKVYSEAPSTSSKDFKRAREALKINEEFTFNEGEVERFLPVSMRSN